MAEINKKNVTMIKVLWCEKCNKRPSYLVKGYTCPDCGSETNLKEMQKELIFPKKQTEAATDALSWLDG